MAGMDEASVDAIVTDPPYDLTNRVPDVGRCQSCGRVLGGADGKPDVCPRCGGVLGSNRRGFMGQTWDGTGVAFRVETWAQALRVARPGAYLLAFGGTRTVHRMTCALEDAGWVIRDLLIWGYAQGFPKSKASLKPAWEPIVLARKPGPLRELNIDAARIGFASDADRDSGVWGNRGQDTSRHVAEVGSGGQTLGKGWAGTGSEFNGAGRWPANVILTDPILDGGWEGVVGGGETTSGAWRGPSARHRGMKGFAGPAMDSESVAPDNYGDTGTASRFFLIPKAPTSERVLSDGRRSPHPTQKPEALIRHLVKLITPDGGLVLDPFLGSGTLGVVCDGLGIRWLGIERDETYADWAEDRIKDGQPEWAA